jgi:hypothetical protein
MVGNLACRFAFFSSFKEELNHGNVIEVISQDVRGLGAKII